MSQTKTQKALDWFGVDKVKRYRDEYECSLMEARAQILDLTITEALKHAHGWEDLRAIMQFQHAYKAI